MVIRTLETTYTVIRQLPYEGDTDVYVCSADHTEEMFLLVKFSEKEQIREAVTFMTENKKNKEFTDLKDCFFSEENFYVAFSFLQSRGLRDIFGDDILDLRERLAMVREIFEKWMVQKLPPYFIYDSARVDRLRFTEQTKCVFCYELADIAEHRSCSFAGAQERFAEVWHEFFKSEISQLSVPELDEFEKRLREKEFSDIPELFVAFTRVQNTVLGQGPSEWERPKTWPFRMWERIKKFFPAVKRLIALALIVIAFMFLFYNIRRSMEDGGQKWQFDRIGTLDIRYDTKNTGDKGERK